MRRESQTPPRSRSRPNAPRALADGPTDSIVQPPSLPFLARVARERTQAVKSFFLPFMAWALSVVWRLDHDVSVGMIILASVPSSPISNLW